jgi:hypothetical protein
MEVRIYSTCQSIFPTFPPKILGFDAVGVPVLPNTSHLTDAEAIRHEKLGWDKISEKSAKIVSFIGQRLGGFSSLWLLNRFRSGWSRTLPQDHSLWSYVRFSISSPFDGWRKRGANWDVQRASSYCFGTERPGRCLRH